MQIKSEKNQQNFTAAERWVLTATILASSMAFIDSTALNIVLPSIQTSLGKADTALQSVAANTITDATATGRSLLTSASAAAALSTLGAGTYSKPGTGIPSSDLTTAVQTSLGLANTALQTVPAGYVQGSANGTPSTLTLWTGTAAQYAAIGSKSSTTVYFVTA